MRRMVEAAAGIKTDVSVLLTDAVKRGQECFCRGGIRYLMCMPACEDDRIPVLTVFLNRVRVLQAREEPALKLTSFKSAVPTLAHTAAVAAVEAFIGFRDLLDLIACKQQPAPIWEIQNRPVPLHTARRALRAASPASVRGHSPHRAFAAACPARLCGA